MFGLAAAPEMSETSQKPPTIAASAEAGAQLETLTEAQLEIPAEAQTEVPAEIHADLLPDEQYANHEPQAASAEHSDPAPALEPNSIVAEHEHTDGNVEYALHEESLLRTPSSDFEIIGSIEDSATGYTEASSEPNEEHSEASVVLGHEEQVSLLEKILNELAARHIVEEQHPADLADKEAQ